MVGNLQWQVGNNLLAFLDHCTQLTQSFGRSLWLVLVTKLCKTSPPSPIGLNCPAGKCSWSIPGEKKSILMQWQREDGAGEYLPRAILAFNRPWSDIWPWNGRWQIWERPLLSFYCTVCWSGWGILVCTLYDYEQFLICTSVISVWIESGKRGRCSLENYLSLLL